MKILKVLEPFIEKITFGGVLFIFLLIPLDAFYFSRFPTQGSTPIGNMFGIFVPIWLGITLLYLFIKE